MQRKPNVKRWLFLFNNENVYQARFFFKKKKKVNKQFSHVNRNLA